MAKYIKTEEGYKTPEEAGVSTNILHSNAYRIAGYDDTIASLEIGDYHTFFIDGYGFCIDNQIEFCDSVCLMVDGGNGNNYRVMRGVCTRDNSFVQGVLFDNSNKKVFLIYISTVGSSSTLIRLA